TGFTGRSDMRSAPTLIVLASLLSIGLLSVAHAASGPPVAPVRNVVEERWGVKLTDPYRYMEDSKSPEVQAWIKGQADYADSVLSRMPIRDELLARIKELDSGRPFRVTDIWRSAGGPMFYLKVGAGESLEKLYMRKTPGGTEALLLDPSTLTPPGGGHYAI